jgi:hypothetical protein
MTVDVAVVLLDVSLTVLIDGQRENSEKNEQMKGYWNNLCCYH